MGTKRRRLSKRLSKAQLAKALEETGQRPLTFGQMRIFSSMDEAKPIATIAYVTEAMLQLWVGEFGYPVGEAGGQGRTAAAIGRTLVNSSSFAVAMGSSAEAGSSMSRTSAP